MARSTSTRAKTRSNSMTTAYDGTKSRVQIEGRQVKLAITISSNSPRATLKWCFNDDREMASSYTFYTWRNASFPRRCRCSSSWRQHEHMLHELRLLHWIVQKGFFQEDANGFVSIPKWTESRKSMNSMEIIENGIGKGTKSCMPLIWLDSRVLLSPFFLWAVFHRQDSSKCT